jgi:hypothetical protein
MHRVSKGAPEQVYLSYDPSNCLCLILPHDNESDLNFFLLDFESGT